MPVKPKYTPAFSFLIMVAAIIWSFYSLMPSKLSDLNTPLTEFSYARALIHLKEISQKPHYIGTENHGEVRNYIVQELQKLGLEVEIQDQVAINKKSRAGVNTKNILAKIKGTKPGQGLMLLTHYDSAPHSSSLGASDAGSGVVTILEGLRAYLATNPKPQNDIVILISDAEEIGLLGAEAFVNHHPWAKEIKLVLNFEARGSGGPSFMLLETNLGNKNLIAEFNASKPTYPVANSLLYSIYKMLPNDTDLTVLRETANINGFNFAFIDDHFDYHTSQDSFERLDRNTLKHQGAYLMHLLPHFANADLSNLNSETDLVYFSFPGFGLINYPFSWVLPMVFLGFVMLFVLIFLGFKKNKIQLKPLLLGFIPFLSSLVLAGSLGYFGWKLILLIHPQYTEILHGFTYNGYYYIAAVIALCLAVCFAVYRPFFLKYESSSLMIAPLLVWLVLNTLIALYLPGAGFFVLAVYIALVILAAVLFSKESVHNKTLFFSFLTVPVLIVFAPMIKTFPVGLGLKMLAISAVFVVLLFGLFLPVFKSYKNQKALSRLFFFLGVLALVSAYFSSGFNTDRKQPNSLVYLLDADENKAYWASYDQETDDYTRQYLGERPEEGNFYANLSSSKYGTPLSMYNQAEKVLLPTPEIRIITDTILGEERKIVLRIIPLRKVNRIELLSKKPMHFTSFEMNGEKLHKHEKENYVFTTEKYPRILTYYFTEAGEFLELGFTIPLADSTDMILFEASFDLHTNPSLSPLNFSKLPRAEVMMPKPFVLNEAVIVKKDISIPDIPSVP